VIPGPKGDAAGQLWDGVVLVVGTGGLGGPSPGEPLGLVVELGDGQALFVLGDGRVPGATWPERRPCGTVRTRVRRRWRHWLGGTDSVLRVRCLRNLPGGVAEVSEVGVGDPVDHLGNQLGLATQIAGRTDQLVHEIAGLATS
jgi:hypothetical protein